MLASLKTRTGRSVEEWLEVTLFSGARDAKAQREFLRSQGLGASSIGLVIDHAAGKSPANYNPEALVANLFKGPKTALLPLYQTVLDFALAIGPDVKACPCATMIPFYRNHVFAQVKPATKSRLDLGLALGSFKSGSTENDRLINTGGFEKKDRITHRIELSAPSDFNDFARDWLLHAYKSE